MRLASAVLLCLVFVVSAAWAQPSAAAEAGSGPKVYLLTMGPGRVIYERFGHNAIWIEDRRQGINPAFNYGVFDLGERGFIWRFLQGRMWYRLEAWDATSMLDAYKEENRSIWVQELNLTSRQRVALYRFLMWNNLPGNRAYRYDYYTDNCSTRVRDALDAALEKQISQQLMPQPAGTTYRWHTRRAMEYDPVMYTALDAVLGQPIDLPLSKWDECFLPMELQRHLRGVMVRDENGRLAPLVLSERTEFVSTTPPLPERPPDWRGWYLLMGIFLGGILAGLAHVAPRRRLARWGLAVISAVVLFVIGFCGAFFAFAWLFTSHWATYRNENLLQASPLTLALVVLFPAMAFGKLWGRRTAMVLAVAIGGISALGLLLKVLPWFYQVNGSIIALLLPVNLSVAWATWHLASQAPRQLKPIEQKGRR